MNSEVAAVDVNHEPKPRLDDGVVVGVRAGRPRGLVTRTAFFRHLAEGFLACR